MTRSPIQDEAVIVSGVEGIGVQSFRALVGRFGLAGLWQASAADLAASGLKRPLAKALHALLADRSRFEQVRAAIAAELEPDGRLIDEVALATWPGYADLSDRPQFVAASPRFDPALGAARRVAIVGTREPSPTGLNVARELGGELASRGVVIVSGGANGIDSAAHRGAIDANGVTIVVLGSALSQERANRSEHIEWLWQRAAVITEQLYPWPPRKWMFPRRNRIIAALAEIVIVVEGRRQSGALITAHAAQRLGRLLLAVPGRVDDEVADGPNALLVEGARVCRHAGDVWAALGAAAPATAPPQQLELAASPALDEPALSPEEQALARLLRATGAPIHVDEIAAQLGCSPAAVAQLVLQLELKRRVRCEAGQHVRWLR